MPTPLQDGPIQRPPRAPQDRQGRQVVLQVLRASASGGGWVVGAGEKEWNGRGF